MEMHYNESAPAHSADGATCEQANAAGVCDEKKVAGLEGGRVSGNQSAGRAYGARQGPLNVTKAAIGTAATGG